MGFNDGLNLDHQLLNLPTTMVPGEFAAAPAGRGARSRRPQKSIANGKPAFSASGQLFAVGSPYARVDVWDVGTGQWRQTFQASGMAARVSSGRATSMAFLQNSRLAVVFNNTTLGLWSLENEGCAPLIPEAMPKESQLEIRGLAVSGDGKRLAVAGMRMGPRQGFLAPPGSFVFDAPMHGEAQVWDTEEGKLLATFKGKSSEKFANVAMDASGGRIAVVSTGVSYAATMTGAEQQSAEMFRPGAPRVTVWRVP